MSITIENNIPVPELRKLGHNFHNEIRQTIRALKPGQSFVLSEHHHVSYAYIAAESEGAKIVSRKLDKGGWRVWLAERRER